MATYKQLMATHFYHGDFGWYGFKDEVWWDGEDGVTPTDEETDAAGEYWVAEGYNEAAQEYENGLADYFEHMY